MQFTPYSSLKKISISALFVVGLFSIQTTNAATIKIKKINLTATQTNKSLVQLKFEKENNQKIIRVSFNGDEGMEGTLKIFDVKNKVISESSLELIKFPSYASIDVSDITTGTYTAIMYTKKGTHTTTVTIK